MDEKTIDLFGIKVSLKTQEYVEQMLSKIYGTKESKLVTVATLNPEQVIQAEEDSNFKATLGRFDVVVPDGVGIVWAIEELHQQKIDRIAGVDLASALVVDTLHAKKKVYFLGGQLDKSDQKRLRYYFGKILGVSNTEALTDGIIYNSGAKKIAKESQSEHRKVLKDIKKHQPALLLVAYGAPWQEKWIQENRDSLEKYGVKIAMVVGGSFDIWSGKVKRAPLSMRRLRLEWLWRLLQEPWRWKRQLRLIRFVILVLKAKLS